MRNVETAHSSHTGDPVINPAVLQQYAKRRTGLLERLVAAYLEETPDFHQGMRTGGKSGDFSVVKLNAHSLKSASANLGAVRLSKLCQEIETATAAEDGDGVYPLLDMLGPECFEVEEALKSAVFELTGKTLWDDGHPSARQSGSSEPVAAPTHTVTTGQEN